MPVWKMSVFGWNTPGGCVENVVAIDGSVPGLIASDSSDIRTVGSEFKNFTSPVMTLTNCRNVGFTSAGLRRR